MMTQLSELQVAIEQKATSLYSNIILSHDELTIECFPDTYYQLMQCMRDQLGFEQLIDLCGVDYLNYKNQENRENRFAVVSHLLSISKNCRVRIRVFLHSKDMPVIDSIIEIYNSAEWYEREAFDLFGIIFTNHPDLRRILTDYGFIGHPLRKDFPVSGYVEMRYDEEENRVIYQPVTIEPRENTPRIVREENYGG